MIGNRTQQLGEVSKNKRSTDLLLERTNIGQVEEGDLRIDTVRLKKRNLRGTPKQYLGREYRVTQGSS